MRLNVYMGSEEEFNASVDLYPDEDSLMEYYEGKLEEARRAGLENIDFKSIGSGLEPAESFRLMSMIEEAIVSFQRKYDQPKTVRIVCLDEEVARLYKVVYNFKYAETKAVRMEDDHWD